VVIREPASDAGSRCAVRRGALLRIVQDQRVAFLIVGGINTVVGLVLFIVFHFTLGDHVGYLGSLVLAYAVALAVAFSLHRRFVFRVRGHLLRDYARFVLVNLGAFGSNAVLLSAFAELTPLPVIPAQVLALGLTLVLSFFGHRLFSFRRPAEAVLDPTQPPAS
jgi:putative flippase GtrA